MKTCLVICATSELGQAIAIHLASQFDHMILLGRDSEKLISLKDKLNKQGNATTSLHEIDFSDKKTLELFIKNNKTIINAIVLITPKINAQATCGILDEEWENLFRLTFVRPLFLLHSLIPSIQKHNSSKVVLISGITSIQYLGNYAINGAIRTAWIAQMKAMANEYGKLRINFNTISFGGIITKKFMEMLEEESHRKNESIENLLEKRCSNVPLKKYASLVEVCHAVEGMLSHATDHITGQNIACDGGFIQTY